MSDKINRKQMTTSLVAALMLVALIAQGCTTAGTTTGTSNSNSSASNANSLPATPTTTTLEAKEPERYSVTTTITIQPTGTSPQANIPPLQFSFARLETDRRVSFKLPDPVGEVIYLEKPTLKYLIFPARNQYVELDPNELGFQLGDIMSPAAMIARLKEKTQYEQIGTTTINGRPAVEYRFKAAADTHTKVGTAQADSIVYIDQETGLPLRSEIDANSSSGAGARVTVSAESLQLTPDATLFDVPTNMKKVTSTELKQQVQSFVNTVRAVAGYLREQATPAQPPSGQQ
jgi:outer membrane lipoprotein-sorting protein